MQITTVNYTRTFNLGNYSSEKIGVELSINEGESANQALDVARDLVEQYHSENIKRLSKIREFLGVSDSYQEEINEIIPTQSKETLAEKTKKFIDSCKTKEELKAWELMSKSNPELLKHYNNKLKSL